MGTAPIVELAHAYGLHPRLWLLLKNNIVLTIVFESNKIEKVGVTTYMYIVLRLFNLEKHCLKKLSQVLSSPLHFHPHTK